jgi:5'-nucleotidase
MGPDRPCILVTNDDGYDAPGISVLAEAMSGLGRVVVSAPDREQSASSHALTLHRPLRVTRVAEDRYRVDGTPTDCVHLAIPKLVGERPPDLVVSGINRGLNVGDDVTYSGTVAGALEGALLHVPAIAFSCKRDATGGAKYELCADFARGVAEQVLRRGLPRGVFLNVNFPDGPAKGARITRQGTRDYGATALEREDPAGRPYFWIDRAEMRPTGEPDGDHAAIEDGYVSVSPLHADLTHEATLAELGRWRLETL